MPWMKAGTAGFLAAWLMITLIYGGIELNLIVPFGVSTFAGFLIRDFGLNQNWAEGVGLVFHFGYGIFWSIVLLAIFWDRTSVGKGIGLSMALWLFMMLVLSPIIGLGFFGSEITVVSSGPLNIGSSLMYVVITLILHLVYGIVIGWINSRWVTFGQDVAAEIKDAARKDRIDTGP